MDNSNRQLKKIIEDTFTNTPNSDDISDYYFMTASPPAVRIKGVVQKIGSSAITDDDILYFLKEFYCDSTDSILQNLPHDFAFTFYAGGSCLRFRGNLDRRLQGLDLTIRLLPRKIRSLKDLGIPEYFYEMLDIKQGLILICGPTGSGKTTTMASLIEHINKNYEKKIVTIEDPIEYVFEEKKSIISQREVLPSSSFLPHLKAALRQHPDVIVVGEIRDVDTASVLIQAAETGHLVISTLHTISTQQTLMRLRDMLPSDMKDNVLNVLSNILRAVLVQRLFLDYKNTRRVAYEICIIDASIQQAIRTEKFHQIPNYMQYKQATTGSITMNEVLREFVDRAYITSEEALNLSYDPDNF